MKVFLSVCFFLICSLFSAVAQIEPQSDFTEKAALIDLKGKAALLKKQPKSFNGSQYDLKYHRFNLTIDPANPFISGSVTSYFKVMTATTSEISFDLNSVLKVDSVKHHNVMLNFSQTVNDALIINFSSPLNFNQFDSVTVYYHGFPPYGDGFGSFVQSTHNETPIIWTLSEPYGAKDWWPCKNDLSDKIDSVDIYITTPDKYRAASNGMLVSEISSVANKTYHWKHRYPIAAYLIAFAVTDYAVYSDYFSSKDYTIEILNYVFPENLEEVKKNTPNLIPVMKIFDSLFTPYPFIKERYGHAQFGWSGGMEHQTMSFMGDFGHELMAHEFAHQWVGNMITCSSWHDIWLNEGFATYWTGLTYETMFDKYYWIPWKALQIKKITSKPDGSVYCYDTTDVSRVFDGRLSYSKGAMILHMLRWVTGDSAFYAGMKYYLSDDALKYNYACSDNFITHMEKASNKNLRGFFDNWLYGEGYPVYKIQCDRLNDSDYKIKISQKPSHPSVNYFQMPVPLRFKNNNRDTVIVFDNNYSEQTYIVSPGFVPDELLFDPEFWLIAKCDTINFSNLIEKPVYTIAPNPVLNILSVLFNGIPTKTIELFDATGRTVLMINSEFFESSEIDLSKFRTGIYFLKIYNDAGYSTYKIMKQ